MKLIRLSLKTAAPVLHLVDSVEPFASSNLAAVIVKADLPKERFSWVERRGSEWVADRGCFSAKFGDTGF